MPGGSLSASATIERMLVKKYSNRRLYDTESSRYITLEELAQKIQAGSDARVIDAKTNADLTQVTLTQIILESRRGAQLLPVPLLLSLIRMKEDALAEFFGRYVTWALELYTNAKQGVQAVSTLSPLATLAMQTNPLARLLFGGGGLGLGGDASSLRANMANMPTWASAPRSACPSRRPALHRNNPRPQTRRPIPRPTPTSPPSAAKSKSFAAPSTPPNPANGPPADARGLNARPAHVKGQGGWEGGSFLGFEPNFSPDLPPSC